ncbi:zinc finger domain-containing protein [Actinomadura xylanilytica]|uniref:zinc finger domain-containing protein n=1 Tax=Actinomadura xylanilytica TaxID=887459 RepID=UPI003D81154F
MDLTPNQAALAVERHDCPNCDAPAGSACRTRGGRTAAKYHSPLRPRPRAPRGTGDPCPRRPVPPGRARDVRHPHGARARASGQERRRADDAVRRAPGRRHPARAPHRAAHRDLRPQRHGRDVLAVAGQIERNYIREKTLKGQVIAASKGNHGGRPKVVDDDMLNFAVALKDKGVPVPRHREEAHHQGREERGQAPLGRLALPGPGRSR